MLISLRTKQSQTQSLISTFYCYTLTYKCVVAHTIAQKITIWRSITRIKYYTGFIIVFKIVFVGPKIFVNNNRIWEIIRGRNLRFLQFY